MKLFPQLATAFAHGVASRHLANLFFNLLDSVEKKDFSLLEIVHHYSSGMKSVYTQDVVDGSYLIRQSLGGAGYSGWSGIPEIIEDMNPTVTFEGDNTVMAQQSFNYIFKLMKNMQTGKPIGEVDAPLMYLV